MAINYVHSDLFQSLKQTDEKIKDNYSSSQYIDVLDKLLFKAIKPIIFNTDYVNDLLVELMHLSMVNHRRKISNLDRDVFITMVFSFLVSNKEAQYKLLKKMKIERTFIILVIKMFCDDCKNYVASITDVKNKESKLRKAMIERKVFLLKSSSLLPVLTEVKKFFDDAIEFKKQIIEKYIRLTIVAAQNHYKVNDSKMELDEIIQTMFVYVSHAIDKYDQTKGTLTSYITTWLQHARNQSSVNELETSFILPHAKRNEIKNASVSLESIEHLEQEDNENNDDIIRVRQLAKLADPLGFARMSMDIQEYLTREEIFLQKGFS
jgi:hypothetical protein